MCVWNEFPSSHVSWSLSMKEKTVYSGHSFWCEDLIAFSCMEAEFFVFMSHLDDMKYQNLWNFNSFILFGINISFSVVAVSILHVVWFSELDSLRLCFKWQNRECGNFRTVCWGEWGTWWHSWLRHCATSRKVTGLIPDGVIGVFHWHILLAVLWPWGWLSL